MDSERLQSIADDIRTNLEEVDKARDAAYQQSRHLTRLCARAISAIHREEWGKAEELISEARAAAETLSSGVVQFPALYRAGYTQDALKEYVEANITHALVRDRPLPTPEALGTEGNTWLNGLAEAATELRRRILDIIRHGHSDEAERLLANMDEIYGVLVTFDFNDTVSGGLRRRTDTVRAVLERTRGDVTTSFREAQLEDALKSLEAKIDRPAGE